MKLSKATKYFYPAQILPEWFLVDAGGWEAGRLASRLTSLLRGKAQATYTPTAVPPVFIIVINLKGLRFTGGKLQTKKYYRHSGRPGGLKTKTLAERFQADPVKLFYDIVAKMLPKNSLRYGALSHLYLYRDEAHPHAGQHPKVLTLR